MKGNFNDISIARETVNLGLEFENNAKDKVSALSKNLEQLQHQIRHLLVDLKGNLKKLQTQHVTQTFEQSKAWFGSDDNSLIDLSPHWEKILDFQELLNNLKTEAGEKPEPLFGKKEYEESKKVPLADLERILHQIDNIIDDRKQEIQRLTNDTFFETSLMTTTFDALNRTLRSVLQAEERRNAQSISR